MAYTTLVSGTTITASWANASVRDQVVTPFTTEVARASAISAPVEGMLAPITASDYISYYNGAAWICITPQSASVTTNESRANSAFGALTTPGPAVTLYTGTTALVTVSCAIVPAGTTDIGIMGYAISGATTLASADATGAQASAGVASQRVGASCTAKVTGLTAGSNTFTAQYRTTAAGSVSFLNRYITVVALS